MGVGGGEVCGQSYLEEGGVIKDLCISDGLHITVSRQPQSTGFPQTLMTHLSPQALKSPGFVTLKLLFCRFSVGVVHFAAQFKSRNIC